MIRLKRLLASGLVAGILTACTFTTYTKVLPDPGQVLFGSNVTNTATVINPTTHARLDQEVGIAAHLSREVTGPVRVLVQTGEETVVNEDAYTFSTPGDALAVNYSLSALPGAGHYVFSYFQGPELLATGQLDVFAASPGAPST